MPAAMVQNLCAGLGFLLLVWADFMASRGENRRSAPIKVPGYAFVCASLVFLATAPYPQWPFPNPEARIPGRSAVVQPLLLAAEMLLAALSAYFLVRTVFFEINKKGSDPGALVTSGSYGLCRHPGFWWFALLVLDLAAIRGSGGFLPPAIILVFLDFLLILIQDVYLFPKIFTGYDDYKKSVPFLFPKKRVSRRGGE